MAAAAVQIPSHDRVEPGSHQLQIADIPVSTAEPDVKPFDVALKWINAFQDILDTKQWNSLQKLFLNEAYWRDQLCLSWNYHTFKGADSMAKFLHAHKKGSRLQKIELDTSAKGREPTVAALDYNGSVKSVNAYVTLETDVGRGRGILRLCKDPMEGGHASWKAFTLFTTLRELKGYEEPLGPRRAAGVQHGGRPGRLNWLDRREIEKNYSDGSQPTVLIVGAGQAGLTLAARLKMLGVNTLLIHNNKRVGDNWRKRYHQLVLHDPVWYDHLPYIPFPEFWPKFTPKDKLGDWFDSYADSLELNVWNEVTIKDSQYDDTKKEWTIRLERPVNGSIEERTMRPRFVVQATGHSGEKKFPSHIKGIDTFKGDVLCHSSEHKGAKPNSHGKKAIVVGCCNSGHDIAQDFYENGYDVTIVQRSSTYVMSSQNGLDVLLGGLYDENGPPTEDADLAFMSIPNALLKRIHIDATKEIARRDAPLLDGLAKAGFKLDHGPNDSGFFMKYFQRGGGYYIDVGASQLIIDGKIKVKQGQEIDAVEEHGLLFADGSRLEADEIVFATGYDNMRGTTHQIFGPEIASRVPDVWGFDAEGEIRTMWRRTGFEGLWFMGGNLALCRYFSRMLALQLKALVEGVMEYGDV